jgi:hypothetical protein
MRHISSITNRHPELGCAVHAFGSRVLIFAAKAKGSKMLKQVQHDGGYGRQAVKASTKALTFFCRHCGNGATSQ